MTIRSTNATSRVAAIMAAGMVVLCGCPTTRQTRTVEKSGFLGDYSQLHEGGQGEAQLVYIKPGVRWASYDKVVIDPVTIWTSGDSSTAKVSDADRQLLTDYLDASLRNSLSQMYTLVDRPGPNTLRLRVAITDAKGAVVALNTVSKVVPQLRMLTTVGGLATDTQVLVGRAGVEGEILDGVTRRTDSPPRSIAARVRRPCAGASARGPTCKTPSTSGPSAYERDSQSSAKGG